MVKSIGGLYERGGGHKGMYKQCSVVYTLAFRFLETLEFNEDDVAESVSEVHKLTTFPIVLVAFLLALSLGVGLRAGAGDLEI